MDGDKMTQYRWLWPPKQRSINHVGHGRPPEFFKAAPRWVKLAARTYRAARYVKSKRKCKHVVHVLACSASVGSHAQMETRNEAEDPQESPRASKSVPGQRRLEGLQTFYVC